MRPYEIAFVFACFFQLAVLVCFPERRWLSYAAAGALAASFLLHARSQNLRVDLLGAYVIAAMLVAATIWPASLSVGGKAVAAIVGAAVLAGTCAFAVLHTPTPRGKYLIGSVTPDWRLFASQDPVERAPAIQIWYPVGREASKAVASAWSLVDVQQFFRTGVTGQAPKPLPAAAPAKWPEKFPIILCFSGGAGESLDTIYLVEELVSWGFVVVTASYPVSLSGLTEEELEQRKAELARPLMDLSPGLSLEQSISVLDRRVRERAADASSILNALSALNERDSTGRFDGRLDLDRVGIYGFSFGGAVAAEVRVRDPRFKASANIDGWHFGESAKRGVKSPYLLVSSDDTKMPSADDLVSDAPEVRLSALLVNRDFEQPIAAMEHNGGYFLSIDGTLHANYTDGAFKCTLLRRMPLGRIDPNRAFSILAEYVLTFFQIYLEDRPASLLDPRLRTYPEVWLRRWPPHEASQHSRIIP